MLFMRGHQTNTIIIPKNVNNTNIIENNKRIHKK